MATDPTTMKADMISSLPDDLLCHILSFLPTITAVATSALSRRWRHLWKDLQVLDISEDPFLDDFNAPPSDDELTPGELYLRFSAFVNAVLDQLRVTPTRFRLSCYRYITNTDNTVTNWIHPVISPHLLELNLTLSDHFEGFRFPGVFAFESLVSLTLFGKIYFNHISTFHLPSLKTLDLDVATVNPIGKLLSASPVLETLKLTLNIFNIDEPPPEDDFLVEDLEIDRPSLKYLHIRMIRFTTPLWWCLRLLVCDFPNILEARLFIYDCEEHVAWVPNLIRALRKTKSLVLSYRTTECLLRGPALLIPKFCDLLHLKLHLPYFNSRFLMVLLHKCHMLQVLKIDNHNPTGIAAVFRSQLTTYRSGWRQPTSVPNCVVSCLNILEFKEYQDSDEERAFVEYILQRGLVLETMTIHTTNNYPMRKDGILKKLSKELSTVSMGSNLCQLKLD